MTQIQCTVPEELHRRVKEAAETRNQTIEEFIVEAIQRALAEQTREARGAHGGSA